MIANIPMQNTETFSATFDNSVGALTIAVVKTGKMVNLKIPAGTTTDGGGAVIASGATAIPAHLRPAVTFSVPCVVVENAAKAMGKLIVASTGVMTFSKDAADGVFTNDAVAGWDSLSISYPVPV